MYGQGNVNLLFLEMGRLPCFKAVVRDLTGTIGETEITEASIRADGCKYLQNKDNPGGKGCGSYDGIDFSTGFGSTGKTKISTGQAYYVCFNERSGREDAIAYDENSC